MLAECLTNAVVCPVCSAVGPLHFAGEYASPAYLGTTHGASVTGMKAASEIMALLGLGRARLAFAEAALNTPPTGVKPAAGSTAKATAASAGTEDAPRAKL